MLRVAQDMLKKVKLVKHPKTNKPIQMRIGIHTGSIVGGVIGTTTLRYDIWGIDVLAANLMEANGVPDKIVVSGATYAYLRPLKELQFQYHNDVEVKVMGSLPTYIFVNPEDNRPRRVSHLQRISSDKKDDSSAAIVPAEIIQLPPVRTLARADDDDVKAVG